MWLPGFVLLLVMLSTGCTALEALFSPASPQPRPPAATTPAPPPPKPAPVRKEKPQAPPVSVEPPAPPVAPAPPPAVPVSPPPKTPPVSVEPTAPPVAPAPPPPKPAPVRKETPPAPAPPPPPAVPVPPPAPPPVLSPQVGPEDQDRLQRDAATKIRAIEQMVGQLGQKKLSAAQQETSSTLQSFLVKAREALAAQDYLRATNLADKAQILAEELVRDLR